MDVVHVVDQVGLIADLVLPESLLTDAVLAMLLTGVRDGQVVPAFGNPTLAERPLYARPAPE